MSETAPGYHIEKPPFSDRHNYKILNNLSSSLLDSEAKRRIMSDMSTNSPSLSRFPRLTLLFMAGMAGWLAAFLVAQQGGAEAVEIGRHNTDLLPSGKEADGILGDFVLRNDRVHALISGNLPQRRANMMHDRYDVIPGTLFDLDLAGAGNDQITSFRPGHLSGPVSYVRIASDGSDGAAAIETVRHGSSRRRTVSAPRLPAGAGLAACRNPLHLSQ